MNRFLETFQDEALLPHCVESSREVKEYGEGFLLLLKRVLDVLDKEG